MRAVDVVLALLAPVLCACGSPLVVSDRDDVGRDDESVRPYAAGANVSFRVRSTSPFIDAAALTVTSSDETVFVVDDGVGDVVGITTVGAGSAELVFRVAGDVVDSRRITVREAAAVSLLLQVDADNEGDLIPPPLALSEPLRVLRGRRTRIVVHTLDESGAELFGRAVTAVASDVPGWNAGLEGNGPFSALILAPDDTATDGTLTLQVGSPGLGVPLAIRVAALTDIERIVMDEGGDDGARGWGRRSVVLGWAEDAAGNVLLGNPAWQLEGEDAGTGFALEYKVGVGVPGQELVARLGPVEARRTIYPAPGSANALDGGCAAGGVGGVAPLLALAGLRRRRRPWVG
jgi:uncharacterized protein (TIGR03382 family)